MATPSHLCKLCVLLSSLSSSRIDAFIVGGPAGQSLVSETHRTSGRMNTPLMVTAERTSEFEKASFDTSIDELPKCPVTNWDADGIDLSRLPPVERTLPHVISRVDVPVGMSEEDYIMSERETLLEQLTADGAVWLRGFDLMKSQDGFRRFYELLELEPCQDPLASVGARAVVNKKNAMYEAVNKPSRAKFFVGMHNEHTFKRTNRLGAFVCFKPAETGGEFLLLDGKKMLREIKPEVLQRLYERGVRFSNAELPFFDFLRNTPLPVKEALQPVFQTIASAGVSAKIDMELELRWDENDEDGLRLLAFSPPQPPVNRHPITKEPVWFCNVHSHSRYLRDSRDGKLPETSGSSKLNRTNMFYGDLSQISDEDLRAIDEATMKNLVYVPMKEGDVVLVDNYQVMHGRSTFTGERLHAVTWFQ
eukprot:CAMPEP_0119309460 /NCGR_PEP_ID=MMETSP1333-20130426/15780_1 /TAXON_ID=418940 /ORGANISM="Scyphosphaera apsteinii, Strain RCC1455" /LENGTH=419 /DNA_ID=CAMNT_0007313445 /DNA_START=15 /DNA_END=1274 /DNA_ORIENTATION=-